MITAQCERLADVLPEFMEIFPAHYAELALNKDTVPLAPQYNIYLEREARGELLFVTLRELGEAVGYFVGFIAPGLHYETCLTCHMDIFYVKQDRRGAMAGVKLFNFVEAELIRRGVKRWLCGSKIHRPVDWLLKRQGFEPIEVHYSKMLGE